MNNKMKRKRFLGIGLILSMLIMTACGKSQNTASEATQDSKVNVQVTEPIIL